MTEASIAPGLLLAMPQLADPNFHRSVVLMVEHSAQGSWGLVVNRPSTVALSDILDSLGVHWTGDPDAVVWSGGPVQPRSGWVLHRPVVASDETLDVTSEIALTTSPERLRLLAEAPPPGMRFLMGYAGWGAGQLEMELAEGAWLSCRATAHLVFETEAEAMWGTALRTLGVDPAALVPARGVH